MAADLYSGFCRLCPRACGVKRDQGETGYCGMGNTAVIARAALHFWEEPCLSPPGGASGAVFFSGCQLGCIYCQNSKISLGRFGAEVTPARLREIFLRLIDEGAANIDLVTPTHFVPSIAEALEAPLPVPVVYNCGGYESVETLRSLEGKIQIYMPDMKYSLAGPAFRYSHARDYPETAKAAIAEMYRQSGPYVMDSDGVMKSGLIVRHLLLPGNLRNTFGVIDWFSRTFKAGEAMFSLMGQYTPMRSDFKYPELSRRVTDKEYDAAQEYLFASGIEDGYVQELSSADEEYIPSFDLEGV